MTNKLREGQIIQYLAGADIAAGEPVVIGNRVGIAIAAIANGDSGSVEMEGCYSVNKVSAQAWAAGDEIFWDSSAELFTTVAASNTFAGHAMDIAANPTSTGNLRLSPGYKKMPVQAASVASDAAGAVVDLNLLIGKLKTAGLMNDA
jgi:predicted RecA/RadA family phage recombinase